jgi:hypothetical protein
MAIANVTTNDTFNSWMIKTNQLLVAVDPIVTGNGIITGTVTFTNPSYFNGNNTINVANGVVRVGANVFSSNTVGLVSNSASFTVSGTGQLGTNIYLNVGTLSTLVTDVGTTSIASALSVNTAHVHARAAFDQANTAAPAFLKANNALANANVTLAGSLVITGNLTPLNVVSHGSANILCQILVDAPTIAWDCAFGQIAEITLTATRTMGTPTNIKKGYYTLVIKQGGAGNFNITGWPTAVFKWPGGVAPVLSTAAGATDIITFVSNDGVKIYGTYVNNLA